MDVVEELHKVPWGWWLVLGLVLGFVFNNDLMLMVFGVGTAAVLWMRHKMTGKVFN